MNFETVEDEIVARLLTVITDPNVTVIPLPEEETEVLPGYGKRKIIVAFASEDDDPDENTSIVVQNTHITFSCLLQGKRLRGAEGLYALAEVVKTTLMGFKPTDCRELTYGGHKFVKNDKKVFEYLVDFKTQGTRVQIVDEETGPPFKSAEFIPFV